jgi:hypothetical protein
MISPSSEVESVVGNSIWAPVDVWIPDATPRTAKNAFIA